MSWLRIFRSLGLLAYTSVLLVAATSAEVDAKITPRTITVAIVDDGVDVDRPPLSAFAWRNLNEVPGNGFDDDGNGYIDDIHGWDFADGDAQPFPPGLRPDRDHGSYLARLILRLAAEHLEPQELVSLRILPVKVMSDNPRDLILRNAFDGVRYAAQLGADVILTAWNDPVISAEEEDVLRAAHAAGALLVGSAGNLGMEQPMYPAAHDAVLAVAALRDSRRLQQSNYGGFVDLAAPGFQVGGAGTSEFGWRPRTGTSSAAALVAGAAAILMATVPSADPELVRACIISTAKPINGLTKLELGRVGAGELDIASAKACVKGDVGDWNEGHTQAKGYLFTPGPDVIERSYNIRPAGTVESLEIRAVSIPGIDVAEVLVNVVDPARGRTVYSGSLDAMPALSISRAAADVRLRVDESLPPVPLITYAARPTQLQNRYCRQTRVLEAPVIIEDGSGLAAYAPGSDCRWLITAPPGMALRFVFLELDTEARRDLLYLFLGATTGDVIAAVASGEELPEPIVIPATHSLLWFVTDLANQKDGFRIQVDAVPFPEPDIVRSTERSGSTIGH